MATVESECAEILCRLSEGVHTNEDSSSFKHSCMGLQRFTSPESSGKSPLSSTSTTKRSGGAGSSRQLLTSMNTNGDILNADGHGWTRSLAKLPAFTHEKLENKLVKNSRTMPDKVAPKAYRNMKKG